MTYKDVYKKFMIEYDKADISSSYPSLTIYEIATLLDKAYLALLSQKVTGNNPRQSVLDSDPKAMSDIQNLIKKFDCCDYEEADYQNEFTCNIDTKEGENVLFLTEAFIKPHNQKYYNNNVLLISSVYAPKFRITTHNKPWIKQPVCFMQDDQLHVLLDRTIQSEYPDVRVVCICKPYLFTDKKTSDSAYNILTDTEMQIPDTTCEELINLAIIFACENVENPRLSSKIQTKSLEA